MWGLWINSFSSLSHLIGELNLVQHFDEYNFGSWWEISARFSRLQRSMRSKRLRPRKSLLRTSESSRILNKLYFDVLKTKKWVVSQNNILNFNTFSVRGCWGQLMLLFWKLVDETQMSKPLEATRHHNSTKLLIFLPLRAIYTFQ